MNHYLPQPWSVSIDKFSAIRSETNPSISIETCDRLIAGYESGQFPGAMLKSSQRHRFQLAIPIVQNGVLPERLLIQAGPRFRDLCDYRVEFNPALMGSAGVEQVVRILDSIFIGGGRHLLQNSIVTRIDIALDLLGSTANQIIVRSVRQRTHGIFSNKDG